MVYLTRLTDQRPDAAIDAAVRGAIQEALTLFSPTQFNGAWPRGGLGITNLTPRAISATNRATGLQSNVLGSTTWGIGTSLVASTWTDWINITLDDRIFIVWTGITHRSAEPRISMLGPAANGQELPNFDITEMYTWDLAQAFLLKPLIIRPENNFTLRVVSPIGLPPPLGGGDTIEKIGLMGYVIAKTAYLIAEA